MYAILAIVVGAILYGIVTRTRRDKGFVNKKSESERDALAQQLIDDELRRRVSVSLAWSGAVFRAGP